MKKFPLAVAVASLTSSFGAHAALPTDAAPFQVVVPNLKGGLEATLEGALLKPSNSDMDYVLFTSPTPNPPAPTNDNVQTVNPGYHFGFRVGIGYIFPNSGNDIQANWTHLHATDSSEVTAGVTQVLIPNNLFFPTTTSTFFSNPSAQVQATATGTIDSNYDAIDLDAGQYLDIGTRLEMRLFAGLRYAIVRSDQTNDYYGFNSVSNSDASPVMENQTLNSKFTGIGPRFGIDSTYHIGDCFGLVGHAAGALLVGRVRSNSTATNTTVPAEDLPIITNATLNSTDSKRVVPAYDLKAGLNYTKLTDNGTTVNIEAGYEWIAYIDAVDRIAIQSSALVVDDAPAASALTPSTFERTTSGAGYDGPYLSLNVKL